jgi:formamidopyrimidine-DNA glycosylase
MPELPEVETTTRGLRKEIIGLKILDVWTDLKTKDKRKVDTISNPKYFLYFKKEIKNKKILSVERRAKNILINLSGYKTILIHMKMTGYLFYGKDPKIKYAHVVFTLSNKHFLVFSDLRKFGKITLLSTREAHDTKHLKDLGLEPLNKSFTLEKFKERILKKPNGKIKTVLMDQTIIAGVGNIYSDEILWLAGVRPERRILKINEPEFKKIFKAMKETLKKGIAFGGDSTSDYFNIYGLPGKFQLHHNTYRRTGEKCKKSVCRGIILRKIINGRSAHFCSIHQL